MLLQFLKDLLNHFSNKHDLLFNKNDLKLFELLSINRSRYILIHYTIYIGTEALYTSLQTLTMGGLNTTENQQT